MSWMKLRTKQFQATLGGVLLLCLLLGVALTYITQARAAGSDDLDQLATAAEELLLDERSITLIHREIVGRYIDNEKFTRLANAWALTLSLPSVSSGSGESTIQNAAPVYRMEYNLDPRTKLSLQFSVLPDQTIYTFLKLHIFGSSTEANQSFSEHRADIELALSKLGAEPNWNMIIQGRLSEQSPAQSGAIQSYIQHELQGHLVEEYSDAGTSSWTFYTPSIRQNIFSGTKPVNLQINMHKDTEDQHPVITIGMPLITTDGLLP
jgi:hypothetical protein